MATDLGALVDDLEAEEEDVAALLRGLSDDQWDLPTPAAGWRVRHQVSHLADGEELAALSLRDEDAFAARLAALLADLDAIARGAEHRALAPPVEVLRRWETARGETLDRLRARPGSERSERVAWVTGPISTASFTTARLMETWAHGQDMADALGVVRTATSRLRHIAHLGVATRAFSFTNRGLDPPTAEGRVELEAPDGSVWSWGPERASERVVGPAVDFCLVVTQRRNVDDTAIVATGEGAARWLEIAQCFAGPPTDGPPAGRST